MKVKNIMLSTAVIGGIIASLYGLDYYVGTIADIQSKATIYILWLAIILILGKMSGAVERFGQAAVLGELIVGLLLGNATLIGITFLEPVKTDAIIGALSRLGTIILFFQAGLVSDIRVLMKTWKQSLMLAVLGVGISFAVMYFVLPMLIPGLPAFVYVFLACALSPTGVGVTARVLQDLGKLKMKEAQSIMNAGAVDNIICFIILAILTAFKSGGINHTQIGLLLVKVVVLLIAIVAFCLYMLPIITKKLAELYPSRSLKFAIAFGVTLLASYFAHSVGISPIIGAFVAGLAMSPSYFTYFKPSPLLLPFQEHLLQNGNKAGSLDEEYKRHIDLAHEKDLEDMLSAPAFLLVAVFFVVTGMGVPLTLFTNLQIVQSAIIILVLSFVTKSFASGITKQGFVSVVGVGMSPRGVTTLVYATAGRNFDIISADLYALIVLTVMLTTFVTPIALTALLRRK